MSRAAGTAANPTASFIKACWRSMTTSAVRGGSRSAKECSVPRRSITRCTIASGMTAPFSFIEIPPIDLARCRRVRADKLDAAQIRPQPRRDRIAQKLGVFLHLLDITRAGEDCRYGRMGEWKLERRRDHGHSVAVANRPDLLHPSDDRRGSGPVIPAVTPCQNTGVVHRPDHDRNARTHAFRHQVIERILLEECIPTSQKKGVPVSPFHRLQQRFPLVNADSDRAYCAAATQFVERTVSTVAKRPHYLGMRIPVLAPSDVVRIEDVDPRQPEPLQTILECAHDPIVGVVESGIERQRMAVRLCYGRLCARTQ